MNLPLVLGTDYATGIIWPPPLLPLGIKTLSDDLGDHARTIAGRVAGFETSLGRIAASWQSQIAALAGRARDAREQGRLIRLAALREQVSGHLQRLGYERLAVQFVAGYRLSETELREIASEAGMKLPVLPASTLTALRDIDTARFVRAGENAVALVSENVMLNVLGDLTRREVVNGIRDSIDSTLRRYAITYADTGLHSYDRTVQWETWKQAEIESFRYEGPDDDKTREWCRARIGKTFTREQIEDMDNGQGLLPVSEFGGGWNCRHRFSPILEK